MHVTRVELENIKSHAHKIFTFARGTTAITGANGAGKTTILEAIAWALFDTLEYNKEDFVRRGAKKGSVRVTFESDLDERQYTVYRDTGTGYYVFDHGLNMRIAERRVDVSNFLRQHLGIEPGTDLKALFRSAIGVPQGSFTAEFLLAPGARKAAFDRLLKVEEYRDSAERLRDTVGLIRERTAEVRERIAGAEGQLAHYDELLEEHKEAAVRANELETMHTALQNEIAERTRRVSEMDKAEAHLVEARTRADRLEVALEAAARRVADLKVLRDAANAARERQRAIESEHRAHLAALETLHKLESSRTTRDRLRAEAQEVSQLLMTARADVRRLEEAVQRARDARAQLVALEPEIVRQEELERERERLRDLRAQAVSAQERLGQLERELEALRAQHTQTKERLKKAEQGAGAEERVAQLESERLEVETTLSKTERAVTSLKLLARQREEVAREAQRLRRNIERLEKEVARFEKMSARAADALALLARETELTERLAHLRAEITRDEKFHLEVKNGLCPILSERCLNIGEGQTLEDYFTGQFAINSAQLHALEEERKSVAVAVREAREAEAHSSRLETLRQQLENERQLLLEREAMLARLDAEITALPETSEARRDALSAQLSGIDATLIAEREAALRYAELKPLQQRLQEIEQEGKRRREDHAGVAAVAAGLKQLEKENEDTEKRLRQLKDPRARAHALRMEAESEATRQSEFMGASDALRALEEQTRSFAAQLSAFDQLDAEWEAAREQRDRTLGAYREYLASEALAVTLPMRQAELEKAESEAANVAREAEAARESFASAERAYDREQHAMERAHLSTAREQSAATVAQLEAARNLESSLGTQIEKLKKVRDEMREEFRAKEKLEELNEATDFIRDILKQAGPLVTESYLYNISIEANQLFREITGDAGRSLRWSRDYEIVLEEEGYERSFPKLSGGEQMAAALSIRLALLKQLSDIRIAFFDEPTVNMDAERRERLAQQIGQVRHFDQLFVISHDDTFAENVDHIIHVERESKDESEGLLVK